MPPYYLEIILQFQIICIIYFRHRLGTESQRLEIKLKRVEKYQFSATNMAKVGMSGK